LTVIPGRCDSIEPGISRFRVRLYEAPRNDSVLQFKDQAELAPVLQDCYKNGVGVKSVHGPEHDHGGSPPESALRTARLDGRRCLARGRHVAIFGTSSTPESLDRSRRAGMARADVRCEWTVDRGDLHRRRTRCAHLPAGLARSTLDQPMLPRLSRLLQDLEDGNCRR